MCTRMARPGSPCRFIAKSEAMLKKHLLFDHKKPVPETGACPCPGTWDAPQPDGSPYAGVAGCAPVERAAKRARRVGRGRDRGRGRGDAMDAPVEMEPDRREEAPCAEEGAEQTEDEHHSSADSVDSCGATEGQWDAFQRYGKSWNGPSADATVVGTASSSAGAGPSADATVVGTASSSAGAGPSADATGQDVTQAHTRTVCGAPHAVNGWEVVQVQGGWLRFNEEKKCCDAHCSAHAGCKMDRRLRPMKPRGGQGRVVATELLWLSKACADKAEHHEYKVTAGEPDSWERRKELRAMFAQRAESEDIVARILRAERPRDEEDSDDEPLYVPA